MSKMLKWAGHGAVQLVGAVMWLYLIVYWAKALAGVSSFPWGTDDRNHRPVRRVGVVHTHAERGLETLGVKGSVTVVTLVTPSQILPRFAQFHSSTAVERSTQKSRTP